MVSKVTPRARRSAIGVGLIAVALIAFLAVRTGAPAKSPTTSLGGHLAPVISGNDLVGGRPVSLAQFRGRYVLVDFFASWCATCLEEEPSLEAFAFSHRFDRRVALLGVDIDDVRANAVAFVGHYGVTWPTVVDSGAIAQSYGVADPPDLFLVDPSGRVLSAITSQVTLPELNSLIRTAESARL